MRFLYPVAAGLTALAFLPATAAPAPAAQRATLAPSTQCQDASKHFAREGRIWRKAPAKPRKLAELPPADTFAAVYRLDERGCMVPVLYRDVRFVKPGKRR